MQPPNEEGLGWWKTVGSGNTGGMSATERFVILCWLVFFLFWAISALWTKRTLERQPLGGSAALFFFLVVAIVFLNVRFHWVALQGRVLPERPLVGILADVLVFLGLLITLWARVVLGRNWSSRVTFKVDHELIQRGPYHWVRHPIYSGLLLMGVGTAMSCNRVNFFLGMGLCSWGLWVKLRKEEALMTKHFPEVYPEYKARTKALIPFVW